MITAGRICSGAAVASALCMASPARAGLEVDFITSRGTITAVMEYEKAPMAVANLISLAGGSRAWVDPVAGQVKMGRFFDDLEFYQVVNSSSEKTISLGSPTGSDEDGPGYQFPDEFDPSLVHSPYVLSMSNAGPNTNGSAFCFTGNLTMASRDWRHTVFGNVPSAAGRAVVDDILAAGAGSTILVSVVVRRTDPAALAFDESAVALPSVRAIDSPLRVVPGSSVEWLGLQPASSVLLAYQSMNLREWYPHYRHMVGLDDPLPAGSQWIDGAEVPARFYNFSLVTSPDAGGVAGFGNRTLTLESPGSGTLIYHFNAEGAGGTYENIVFPGDPPLFSGAFQVDSGIPPLFNPYSFTILLHADGLGGRRSISYAADGTRCSRRPWRDIT